MNDEIIIFFLKFEFKLTNENNQLRNERNRHGY